MTLPLQDDALSILLLELMRASQLQLEAAQSDGGDEGASDAGGPAGSASGLGLRAGHALDLASSICNQVSWDPFVRRRFSWKLHRAIASFRCLSMCAGADK